jgi:hypothetical protein
LYQPNDKNSKDKIGVSKQLSSVFSNTKTQQRNKQTKDSTLFHTSASIRTYFHISIQEWMQ